MDNYIIIFDATFEFGKGVNISFVYMNIFRNSTITAKVFNDPVDKSSKIVIEYFFSKRYSTK